MKKIVLLLALFILFSTTQANAEGFLDSIKGIFHSTANAVKEDMNYAKTSIKNNTELSIQDEIDKVKAKRDKELAPINKKISDKEALVRKTVIDTNLTISQKKAKIDLLNSEIKTLKTQKENIEEQYRQQIRNMR